MPPVLGPVSPSPTCLWSCAVPKGSAVLPSQRQKKLASSPVKNSSTTTSAPALPNEPSKQSSMAAQRLGFGHRDGHALAGRKPVGLDDDRRAVAGNIGLGLRRVVEAAIGAVGMS